MVNYYDDDKNNNKERKTSNARYNCSPPTDPCQTSFPKPRLVPLLGNSLQFLYWA